MTLKQLEESIAHLPPDELARFRDWFFEFDGKNWDAMIDADATEGRFNRLTEEAIADHRAGRTRPL